MEFREKNTAVGRGAFHKRPSALLPDEVLPDHCKKKYGEHEKNTDRAARTVFVRRGIARREYFVYFQGQQRSMTKRAPLRIRLFCMVSVKGKKELSPDRFISSAVRAQLCEFLISNILVTSLSSDFSLTCRFGTLFGSFTRSRSPLHAQ